MILWLPTLLAMLASNFGWKPWIYDIKHFQEEAYVMREQEQNKTKKGGFVIGIAAAVVVIAALMGVIIFLLLSRNAKPEEEKRNVVITPENVESVLEELTETQFVVPPGYYTASMNTSWHFAAGNEASYDAVVENVEANTKDVYFDIVLEEDESKVLYQSPVIPRGGRLEEITLNESLAAGNYNCVVIYHLIDEEQNTLSTLRIGIAIIIES